MSKLANFRMCWLTLAPALLFPAAARADDAAEALDQFEREVRPVLIENCQKCHGPEKQESDLRLDTRASLLEGGVSGAAIVPGDPDKSLLIEAIRQEGDLQMPPKGKLTEAQIAAVSRWIKLGAPWPAKSAAPAKGGDAARTHWAFQPVRDPPVPTVEGNASPNPIDAFIRARLKAEGLTRSPPADPRTLIRRASFDLTGLPPSAEEVEEFVRACSLLPSVPPSPSDGATERQREGETKAFEAIIDRLLASPHYGEQWGRHWLDVARYSDTKGYVYAREQRFWLHAWVYRDWVVKALNDDMPYDRFLLLQIAADQAAPDDPSSLAAMGFLTLGRRFLGVQRDIIDDRIDVVTRGTMGLTVACARCHDHKYDPIPTDDYYSLYGVFQSCTERIVPIGEPEMKDEAYQKYEIELAKRKQTLADAIAARRLETAGRNRSRVGDYLAAQLELSKYPEEGFDQILATTDLLPNFVRKWQAFLADAKKRNDPAFVPWHAYAEISAAEFSAKAPEVTAQLAARPAGEIHPLVAPRFAQPPASLAEVAKRYGELFAEIERQWQEFIKAAAEQKQPAPPALPDPAAESIRQILYSPAGPCEVPDESIVNIEYYVDSDSCNALWKLQNEVDNWILQAPTGSKHAIVLNDRDPATTPRVFKRGNPANKGDEVPRQFVAIVAGKDRQPFGTGSGRLELAKAIIDPANPLTARVIVNRVWAHHFGTGLVPTPSDFGTRAPPPSHPELLDWLTSRFIEEGWSLKKLHRRIMLSETYRQASQETGDRGQETGARGQEPGAIADNPQSAIRNPQSKDPENRLLWRMNERRLSFEEMRDSLLAAAGRLDRTVGGRAGDLFSPSFGRRSLYGTIDRQFLPSTLRMFDFANPDLHIPVRSETTVPQQALFFLNDPLMVGYAQALAQRTAAAESGEARIQDMYRFAYQRQATTEQVQAALALIELAQEDRGSVIPPTVAAWQYGFGSFDDRAQRVAGFEKLPHFTGSAWQGGSAFPDGKLGWVQLTAAGGHPGDDLAHAAIRRWTAPRDMRVRVQSTLIHEPKEGQGVRGFLVSSRAGLLQEAKVHNGQAELSVDQLEVKAGDTLDFVADIGSQLSHNQFLWKAVITPEDQPDGVFDSARDFENQGATRLTPWEQLAQVLLSANEFVFVD
jgi:mono/diheme cytochrome c family protein